MQAVILAGGLATRMRPHTIDTPKALIEVLGRPFLAWQLQRVAGCGYSHVVLCIGHLGDRIRDFVGNGEHFDLEVSYSDDGPRLLRTAGALREALPLLEPTFLVTYGDSYLPCDYAAPMRDLAAHPEALGTMSVFKNAGRWDESNCAVNGELVSKYEKGSGDRALDYIDYGAIALRREVIAKLPLGEPYALDALQSELAAQNRLRALVVPERFYEIGSAAGLRDLEQFLKNG